jgi:MFS transporter, DHA2 family, multidrug resistance protein
VAGLTLLWLGHLNLNAGYWNIFWPQFFQGLGMSMVFVPLTTISMDPIPQERMGNATSLFNLMRNLGGSIGISIVVALLSENTQTVHSRLIENLRPDNPLAQAPFLAPPFSLSVPNGIAALNAEVTRQAQMVAYIDDFKLMMIIVVLAAPLLLLLRKPRAARSAGLAAAE